MFNCIKAQIVINEVMPYPNTSGTCAYDQSLLVKNNFTQSVGCGGITTANGNEWIELFNPTCSDIDISHWFIATNDNTSEGQGIIRFPVGTIIPSLGFISIGGQEEGVTYKLYTFNTTYGSTNIKISDANRWYLNNGNCWVGLYNANGVPVDAVYWTFSSGQSSRWGNSSYSELYYAPIAALIPAGSAGAPVVASLPGPQSAALTAVADYLGALSQGSSKSRSVDGGSTWVNDNTPTLNSNNAAAPSCVILPIELSNFDYSCHNDQIKLNWATATEVDNSHFSILGSTDANEWLEIGTQIGAGNSSEMRQYEFDVPSQYSYLKYFKLAQHDYDSHSKFTNIISVDCDAKNLVDFYPNPFNNELNFTVNPNESISYEITTVLGQVLNSGIVNKENSRITLENLACDIYFIKINNSKVYKIIKQ
jgi:hypothetical protein